VRREPIIHLSTGIFLLQRDSNGWPLVVAHKPREKPFFNL
jgi:hypothetical protein